MGDPESHEPMASRPPGSDAPPTSRPPVWPAFLTPLFALCLAIAFQLGAATLVTVWLGVRGTPLTELGDAVSEALKSEAGILVMVILGPGSFGIAAWLAVMRSGRPLGERLGFLPVVEPAKTFGLTMVGSIVPLTVAIGLAYLVAQFTPSDTSFVQFFEQVTPLWGVLFVIAIALVPGFCEETLFRGYVQQRLVERWGPAWGIGWASVLFALAHIMPPNIAVALPLGVWLGILAWRTGSIWPSVACHAFVNGGLNAWRLIAKFTEAPETAVLVGNVCFVLAGVVAFYCACVWLARYPRPPAAPPSAAADEAEGAAEREPTGD